MMCFRMVPARPPNGRTDPVVFRPRLLSGQDIPVSEDTLAGVNLR